MIRFDASAAVLCELPSAEDFATTGIGWSCDEMMLSAVDEQAEHAEAPLISLRIAA